MQILIMRHGQADLLVQPDQEKPLTAQGELEVTLMASWMKKMAYQPDVVWVSPYLRAQQTCKRVVDGMELTCPVITQPFITPSGVASQVHDIIDGEIAASNIDCLLIVAHMPVVSYLVDSLTKHQHAPIFQTASIVEIDYQPKQMVGNYTRMVSPIDLC